MKEAEIFDNTDIVLLSDHGQIGITRTVYPNVYLREAGYITLTEDGKLNDWKAFVKSAGGSAQIYLKNPEDKEVYDGVYKLFSEMADAGLYGFEKVHTIDEVKEKYGLSGDFSFVLETDGYTGFAERITGKAVSAIDFADYSAGRGRHGHAPEKGPQPIFIANGPSFCKDVMLSQGDILNHAPTLAAVLGIELRGSVGVVERKILK